MLRTLYKEDDRFVETYWDKFGKDIYLVGDAARRDEDGYFWIIGRIDDVVNVSGHRLSTAEVESAIVSHPKVAEAAVIGQADEDTGQAITAFVTLEGDHARATTSWSTRSASTSPARIGKFARPKRIIWADDLPKTRSGKIMRRLLRDIAEGRELGDVTTLRDPDVMAAARGQDQGAPGRGRGLTTHDPLRILAVDDERPPALVFVSAHDRFAAEAFSVAALDYLLKPVARGRLQEAVRRIAQAVGATPAPDAGVVSVDT